MKKYLTAILCTFLLLAAAGPLFAQSKAVFIGASTFHDWMGATERDSRTVFHGNLLSSLNANNYYVNDLSATNIYFDSGVEVNSPGNIIASNNIGYFYTLFRGVRADTVYMPETYTINALSTPSLTSIQQSSGIVNPGGENEIIMFKANHRSGILNGSPSGSPTQISSNPIRGRQQVDYPSAYTIENAKSVYLDLLNYFAGHQDKFFVAITSPSFNVNGPGYSASTAANTRAFSNWLVNDWLDNYPYNNVMAFDYFNILTHVDNHHRLNPQTGAEEHITVAGSPNHTAPEYAYLTDIHPTALGHNKATAELIPLLNSKVNAWKSGTPVSPTPTPTPTPMSDPLPSLSPTPTPSPACQADVNANGTVEIGDISGILFYWGQSCAANMSACIADVNGNGTVEVGDIAGALFYWGNSCIN